MYRMNKVRDATMIPVKSISTIDTLTPIATPEINNITRYTTTLVLIYLDYCHCQ